MLLKIITLLFVLFIGSKILRKFKERSMGISVFIFSVIILASLLLVVFEPHISDAVAHAVGVQHGTDIAFFFAILILIYLVFRLYSKIVAVDRALTKLTTNISIELHKNEKKDGEI